MLLREGTISCKERGLFDICNFKSILFNTCERDELKLLQVEKIEILFGMEVLMNSVYALKNNLVSGHTGQMIPF